MDAKRTLADADGRSWTPDGRQMDAARTLARRAGAPGGHAWEPHGPRWEQSVRHRIFFGAGKGRRRGRQRGATRTPHGCGWRPHGREWTPHGRRTGARQTPNRRPVGAQWARNGHAPDGPWPRPGRAADAPRTLLDASGRRTHCKKGKPSSTMLLYAESELLARQSTLLGAP